MELKLVRMLENLSVLGLVLLWEVLDAKLEIL